ncbi:MAG: 1-phosphofructokinase [Lautropia sp.]|nr:1-phosphofructokinase [Lautropia sp.]
MTQVLTITLNPAIDQTIPLKKLIPGEVHRATGFSSTPGGKGIGVSIILASLGVRTTATGWIGADNDSLFVQAFQRNGIKDAMVRLPGHTRTNVKLVDNTAGESTDINLPGIMLDSGERARDELILSERINTLVRPGDWCEFGGSLPPGVDVSIWLRLAKLLVANGVHVVIDVAGSQLGEILKRWPTEVSASTGPVMIKPNRPELEELVGRSLKNNINDLIQAAEELRAGGVQRVVVSMGGEGALIIGPEGRWLATPPKVQVATTVGAGDTLVAGTVARLLQGNPFPDAAIFGMACAAARIQQIEFGLPSVQDVEALVKQINVHPR